MCERQRSTSRCLLKEGDVTRAEFFLEAESPLAPTSVIGHQAWWNDPPYLKIAVGESVRVKNEGGRTHTFTEVVNFGAGRPRPLRQRSSTRVSLPRRSV